MIWGISANFIRSHISMEIFLFYEWEGSKEIEWELFTQGEVPVLLCSPEVREHPWVPFPQEKALVWQPPLQHKRPTSGKSRKEEMMSENGDPSPMHASLGPNICINRLCAWLACTSTIYNSPSSSSTWAWWTQDILSHIPTHDMQVGECINKFVK